MSDTLLDEGKILIGAITGPATLGKDRALLQFTIRDGSDTAQLNRLEVAEVIEALDHWLDDTGSLI